MEVKVIRENYDRVVLQFHPDDMDGIPPFGEVFFEGKKVGRVQGQRWALIVYLMARDMIGNTLFLDGVAMPPFLGSAFQRDLAATELFIGPIQNKPEKILPRSEYGFGVVCSGEMDHAGMRAEEYELGFRFSCENEPDMPVLITNLRLWMALCSSSPELDIRAIVALITSDVFGVTCVHIGLDAFCRATDVRNPSALCREVGVDVK
jgi:hypothetical protein